MIPRVARSDPRLDPGLGGPRRQRPFGAALLLAVVACGPGTGHGRAEHRGGSQTTLAVKDVPVCGFGVRVERTFHMKPVEGELIAATEAGLIVRVGGELVRVEAHDIHRVIVTVLPEVRNAAGTWTALGALSSLSHGAYAIFSLPLWLVVGTLSTGSLDRDERWAFSENAPELHEYARFPQGLPPGWPGPDGPGACPRPAATGPKDETPAPPRVTRRAPPPA